MRNALVIALAVVFGVASASAVQAQDRDASILDRVFSTVVGEDRGGRGAVGGRGDRRAGRDVDGPRGRTGRTDGSRGSGRSDDARTGRSDDARTGRSDGARGSARTEDGAGRTSRNEDGSRGRGSTRTDDGAKDRGPTRSDGDIYRRGERNDEERGRRDDEYDDEWEDDARGKRGKGPKFCRNGEGHPVHGRAWCREKGFGTDAGYDDTWDERQAPDVLFPSPQRRRSSTVDGGVLGDILGGGVLGRLERAARQLNLGPISGRWRGDSELQILGGSTPLARLVDLNGDNRADIVYLRR